jgi:cysteine-rich repeat protein
LLGSGLVAGCMIDFDRFETAPESTSASTTTSSSQSVSTTGGTTSAGGMGTGGGTGGMGGAVGGSGGEMACGNGALDPSEQCDDGNAASQDGCSSSCAVEGQADMCPTGADIQLAPPGIWISDTTNNKNSGNGTTCGGNSAGDMVYRFTPTQSGTLNIELTGSYDKVMAVRDACQEGGAERFCDTGTGMLSTTYAAQMGQSFHVVVSGLSGDEGSYELHLFY